jgi:RNA polymerase sigma factor (sigma-70 family)
MSPTDAELLRRSRRDPDAFVEVCRRHTEDVRRFLRAQLHDDGLAGELLAETLAEAWFARGRFRDDGDGSARPWLVGIARNLVRRLWRDRAIEARARRRLGLPVPDPDAYAEVLDRLDAADALGTAGERLNALPPEQRAALELRFVHDLEYAEIGKRLAITPEGARTRVFRALGLLRHELTRSDP